MNDFEKYVEPIYGHLTSHTKIFQQPLEEQLHFKKKVIEILKKTDDKSLKKLLWDSNWRFSLLASWLIFLKDREEFVKDIGKFLLQGKAGTIGYCYALTKFGTNECSEYLALYLDKELFFDKIPTERFQDTALYSLMYIDQKNGTDFSHKFLNPNGLWTKFIEFEFLKNRKLADSLRWGNLDKNYGDFVDMFDFMNSITTEN